MFHITGHSIDAPTEPVVFARQVDKADADKRQRMTSVGCKPR